VLRCRRLKGSRRQAKKATTPVRQQSVQTDPALYAPAVPQRINGDERRRPRPSPTAS